MDAQRVDTYLMINGKHFESHQIDYVREKLLNLDEQQWKALQMTQFKDPTLVLIISLLGGNLGIDRFFLGDTGLGLAKLLTCGGLGIWVIVDWFLINGIAKEMNLQMFDNAIH